jgi:hypothetical protein
MLLLAAVTIEGSWYAGWGTLALVNANLGQLKGGSGINWFLASLLLGPLATLLLAAEAGPASD